jgi:ribosomal protein L37AE/L43A
VTWLEDDRVAAHPDECDVPDPSTLDRSLDGIRWTCDSCGMVYEFWTVDNPDWKRERVVGELS